MCYPCRCPRRSVSCHGGGVCCPRPCCRERSRSTCSPRVIFPGEFQKFSDMIPPSFLLKQPPKCEKVKKKSNCESQAAKRKKAADCNDTGNGDNVCDPEEARISGEYVEMPGVPGIPFQPTGTPWCGTNGPWEYPMTIDMPPQPQWMCFECPATVCFPRQPQGLSAAGLPAAGLPPAGLPAAGLPPAGLPTKRSPPFNPCTGQVYHCEHQQMMVGNNNEMAQCPANNQFCHGLNICIGPANSCYQCNPSNFGVGAISNEPNRNQPYYQSNQGINMGYGNVGMATETRKGISSSQSQQYNQRNYGEGANLYEANRDQTYSQFCQGINMCPGNPYYPYDCGDGTYPPPPGDPRSLSPQGESRSKGQRKEKETREGNVGKAPESRKAPIGGQRHQYTQDNSVGGPKRPSRGQIYMDPRRVSQQKPTSGYVSPGGKRSSSQGTRNVSREAPRLSRSSRSNSLTAREKSIDRTKRDPQVKQSGRVAQQNSAAGRGVSGNRSRSQTRGSKSIEAPRLNNQNQYNSYISSKEPTSPRVSLRSNSSGNQVPRSTYRSRSLEPRKETRRDSSARVPHPCKSRGTSPDRALNSNGRSKSLGKRNEPREQRSMNMPASNLNFYQQNMGMSFGPSNQHYIADCPSPDPIYTTQLESTVGDSAWEKRNESPRRSSTRKNGESRKECKCKESIAGNQSARKSPPHQCCTLRFNPNNQYCQYYMPDECSSPPSPEVLRPYGEKSHDRTSKSRSLDDRQMSTSSSKSSKKQPASSANKSANVLVLKTPKDEEKKQIQNDSAETLDVCSSTTQDDDSSCESLDDSCICAVMVNENGKEKDKKKAQEKDKSKAQGKEEAEGQSNSDENSGCPNCCWMRCPNSWSCRCGPCNSPCSGQWNRSCKGSCNGPCGSPCGSSRNCPYHYCGNCCNGCRQCCNYRCNPCGRYCCSKPPTSQVNSGNASPKSKEKPAGRYQGGLSGPSRAFPVPSFSTMPGYYPTGSPQFMSPYSGHWHASEVVSNPMFSKHYP